ncbi:MAG TPA: hypothetical protein VFS09_10960 [Candidatus Eisenbacteria bacterium]|nr:hypothetical protein [Candidatus Eisenbacteria bacterium]
MRVNAWILLAASLTLCAANPTAAEGADAKADSSITAKADSVAAAKEPTLPERETWGTYDPGKGFLVARTEHGELAISAYGLIRYINQTPASQTWTDHLGNQRQTDGRQDLYPHRVMIWAKGWMFDPKLIYVFTLWTVNATDQDALFANIGYQFSPQFNLYAGIAGNAGTRSLLGSHPYWLGNDRVMADEFFRPFFGAGVYANGELFRGLWYNAFLSNSNSILGVKAADLDRDPTVSGSVWYMPTGEFGPRGAYGDYERHEKVATRFGASYCYSPEQSFTGSGTSTNTTLKLADGVNLFESGALANGVTVSNADYRVLAVDAGVKHRGFFLQAEHYIRWLDKFKADGPVPTSEIQDRGFYIQAAAYAIPKKWEVYVATSQIYGDEDAGFGDSNEYILGSNWYPFDTRDTRLNVQYIGVNHSPVGSTFGYYTAGQTGSTVAIAYSLMF